MSTRSPLKRTQPLRSARRKGKVGDSLVVFQLRVHRVMQAGADQLEATRIAERLAVGIGTLVCDFDSFDRHGQPLVYLLFCAG